MAKHNLHESEVEEHLSKSEWTLGEEGVAEGRQRLPGWYRVLSLGVAIFCGTEVACNWRYDSQTRKHFLVMIFVGEQEDVRLAAYLYRSLKAQAVLLAQSYGLKGNSKTSYLEGFASGIQNTARQKPKNLTINEENRYALISTEKKDWLAKKLEEENKKFTYSSSAGSGRDGYYRNLGFRDAKKETLAGQKALY